MISLLNPRNFAYHLRTRRLRRGPEIVQVDFLDTRILVKAREDVGRNMALGEFELDDLKYFFSKIAGNDVIFDIGANVGAYSVPMAKSFPTAKVFAFEPIPLNYSLILASSRINRLGNLFIIEQCLSDESGTNSFSIAEDSAYSSMIDTRRKGVSETVSVRTASLQDFCNENDCYPTVIKMDVEGAEMKVLKGAEAIFSEKKISPRMVMIELYDQNLRMFGTSIDEIVSLMNSYGYSPNVIIDGIKKEFLRDHHNIYYNVFFEK